jgi:hypothetical protein
MSRRGKVVTSVGVTLMVLRPGVKQAIMMADDETSLIACEVYREVA